jgi:hypothetical protein
MTATRPVDSQAVAAIAAALACAACFNPSFKDAIQCSESGACPSSLVCRDDNTCGPENGSTADASAAIDAASIDSSTQGPGDARQVDAGDPCTGTRVAWTRMSPATAPPARMQHAMAYDPVRRRVVLFGGRSSYDIDPAFLLNDTWEWDGENWTNRTPAVSPSPRASSHLVFDPTIGKMLLYGGATAGVSADDTWYWDGTSWERKTTTTTALGRNGHGLSFDASRNRAVVFGGFVGAGQRGDTWELASAGSEWTERAAGAGPPARVIPTFAYDPARGVSVLFGGVDSAASNATLSDTWQWNGESWARVTTECAPFSASLAMAYDDVHDRVTIYTGEQVWTWNEVTWARMREATPPDPRSSAGMAYDGVSEGMLVFGGALWGAAGPGSETWLVR